MGNNRSIETVTGCGDQLYNNPRHQVESISALKVADHIVFQRQLYEHHGIVFAVDRDEGTFDVIEYDGNKSKSEAKVDRKTHIFSEEPEGTLYVVQYSAGECFPDNEVIDNAEKWLDSRRYNILLNNCECMAQACKTGQAKTEQIRHLFKFVAKEAGPPIAKGVMVGAARAVTFIIENAMLFVVSMVIMGGVVETALAANDIRHIVRKNREGKIKDRKMGAMRAARVATAGGDVAGSLVGGVIGFAAGGHLGVLIGGLVGGLGGRLAAWGTSKVITASEKTTNYFGDENNEHECLIQEDGDTNEEDADTNQVCMDMDQQDLQTVECDHT